MLRYLIYPFQNCSSVKYCTIGGLRLIAGQRAASDVGTTLQVCNRIICSIFQGGSVVSPFTVSVPLFPPFTYSFSDQSDKYPMRLFVRTILGANKKPHQMRFALYLVNVTLIFYHIVIHDYYWYVIHD